MVRNNEGLTKTYNRFHDPDERDPDIAEAPRLSTPPWTAPCSTPTAGPTSPPTASFFLDYEIDEETWGDQEEALPLPLARRQFATRSSHACST
jgi:hypothetical protein